LTHEIFRFIVAQQEEFENKLSAAKNQVRSLQDSLETSEHVQQDFVRLSQSLQVRIKVFV